MSRATKKEITTALDEQKYWQELANALNWRIYGWSCKAHASFFTAPNHKLFEVTNIERDAILEAIKRANRGPR